MRTLDALIVESPVFKGLDQDQLELIAGCASNTVFAAGDRLFREGDQADTFFLIRHGLVALDAYVPNRGQLTRGDRRPRRDRRLVVARCRRTAGTSPARGRARPRRPVRRRLPPRQVRRRPGASATTCITRFAQVLVSRLQATRLQLMDVYGDRHQ